MQYSVEHEKLLFSISKYIQNVIMNTNFVIKKIFVFVYEYKIQDVFSL